jgi:hypothetical protein
MPTYAICWRHKKLQDFIMICRKSHMPSSMFLRATIFQNPEGTLWTYCIRKSRYSAAGIATAYGLDGRGVAFRVQIGGKIFLLSTSSRDRLWGLPTLLSNGYRGLFPGGLAVNLTRLPPTSAEVKKTWLYTSTPSWRNA